MRRIALAVVLAGFCVMIQAQTVTFYTPTEWLTQRDGKMVAKVQFDTSKVNKKKVDFTLSVVLSGKKQRIAAKSVTVDDFTKDVDLGALPQVRLGGMDFAVIDWSVPATKEKGSIGPIGIVNFDKIGAFDTLMSTKIPDGTALPALSGTVQEKQYTAVGSASVAFKWSSTALYAVCKGTIVGGTLTIALDGKNAKNGYLSYSDRFVSYVFGKDSLGITHYQRSLAGDSIKYTSAKWNASVKKVSNNGIVTIEIPWPDVGMIAPTVDRRVGMAVFAVDEKGATVASFPAKAERNMPGSWGDVVFR